MTVGELKQLLEPFDSGLTIIVAGPCLDEDGDEFEAWFSLQAISQTMDADTAEDYARFTCERLDDFEPS